MKMLLAPLCLVCITTLSAQSPVDKAWKTLTTAAQDKSYEKRGKAIQAMGLLSGEARAQAAAEAALKDENEDVRSAAAESLGAMRASGSIPKLKAALKDPAAAVVFAAANSLLVMGDKDAFAVYFAVLTGQKKTGDALVESQVKMLKDTKALTKLGFQAGMSFVPFGGISYAVFKKTTADEVSPIRAAAAMKLVSDPDPKTAQALATTAKDEKWLVRAAVVTAIARRNDPALLSAVTPLLDDENDVVRFNAAAAVIHLSAAARPKPGPAKK
jgi:HEAT repeat protein